MKIEVVERFLAKVDTSGECWLWLAATDRAGYGQFKIAGRQVKAHRYAYELLVGPIPPGLVIDHLCRVTGCVRPSHLEPVTNRENVRRGDTAGSGEPQRSRTHCPRGHPYSGDNLYERGGRRMCLQCRRDRWSSRW